MRLRSHDNRTGTSLTRVAIVAWSSALIACSGGTVEDSAVDAGDHRPTEAPVDAAASAPDTTPATRPTADTAPSPPDLGAPPDTQPQPRRDARPTRDTRSPAPPDARPRRDAAQPTKGNLVKNAGFEDGSTHWKLNKGGRIVSSNAHSGSKALEYGQQNVNGDKDEVHHTVTGIVAGTTYEVSAWVMGKSLGGRKGVRIRYGWKNRGSEVQPSEVLFTKAGTFPYTKGSVTTTAPGGANELELILINYAEGSGTAYFDDFSVRPRP